MKCIMCKGNIAQVKHTFVREIDDSIIIIKNVSALARL